MIIGLETILWVWYDIEFLKTHMNHVEIFNISTKMDREFEFPMLPPSEIKLIRHQLSISYGKKSSVN